MAISIPAIHNNDSTSRGQGNNHQRSVHAPASATAMPASVTPIDPVCPLGDNRVNTVITNIIGPPHPIMNFNGASAEWHSKVSTNQRWPRDGGAEVDRTRPAKCPCGRIPTAATVRVAR